MQDTYKYGLVIIVLVIIILIVLCIVFALKKCKKCPVITGHTGAKTLRTRTFTSDAIFDFDGDVIDQFSIQILAGGAGGGGPKTVPQSSGGGGGSSGWLSETIFLPTMQNFEVNLVVGVAGVGGNVNQKGQDGTSSSLSANGLTTRIVTPGLGGSNFCTIGGFGGSVSGQGSDSSALNGFQGLPCNDPSSGIGGSGANAPFSGYPGGFGGTNGGNATNFGSGGSGSNLNGFMGGNGSNGVIIIFW